MKEGDKVRIVEIKPCCDVGTRFVGSLRAGDSGEISTTNTLPCGCVHVKCGNGREGLVNPAGLEPIKEETVKTEFKVGDRVQIVKYEDKYGSHFSRHIRKPATVRALPNPGGSGRPDEAGRYEIEFDDRIGHSLCGSCKEYHGRFVGEEALELLAPAKTNVPVMQTILVAINEKKLVGMNYEDKKGEETYRIFKPNTVVEKNGLTVNGYCYLRNEFRGLKMDSIKSAWLLGDAE